MSDLPNNTPPPTENNEQNQVKNNPLDFAKLVADSHLSPEERNIISKSYQLDKEKLLDATKGNLRDFILSDYATANEELLGGREGVKKLQKALGMKKEDGFFGPITFQALIEYQKTSGLRTDGLAGSETVNKIGISPIVNTDVQMSGQQTSPLQENKKGTKKPSKVDNTQAPEQGKKNIPAIQKPNTLSEGQKPSLKRLDLRVRTLESQAKGIIQNLTESKDLIGGAVDGLVGIFGGETVRSEYERQLQDVRTEARKVHGELIKELEKNPGNTQIRTQGQSLHNRLQTIAGIKLEGPSILQTIQNTNFTQAGKNALHGAKGEVVGTINSVKAIITGTIDLAVFMTKYAGSLVGINPEYKKNFDKQAGQIYDWVAKEGMTGMKEKVFEVIQKELERISKLPQEKQAEAMGNIAGNVIGMLVVIKGSMALGQKVSQMSGKVGQAKRIGEKLVTQGKEASAVALRVAARGKQAGRVKLGANISNIIINGFGESLLGYAFAKSLGSTLLLLKSPTASIHDKWISVGNTIEAMREAQKIEKNPKQRDLIQGALVKLYNEADKLGSQSKMHGGKSRLEQIGIPSEINHLSVAQQNKAIGDLTKEIKKGMSKPDQLPKSPSRLAKLLGLSERTAILHAADDVMKGSAIDMIGPSLTLELGKIKRMFGDVSISQEKRLEAIDMFIKKLDESIDEIRIKNGKEKNPKKLAKGEKMEENMVALRDKFPESKTRHELGQKEQAETSKAEGSNEQTRGADNKIEPANYDNIPRNEITTEALKFFDSFNGIRPKYKIEIDGNEFIFTDIIISKGRQYIPGIIKVNGKYEPRMFYFSGSGGNWHSLPGIEEGGRISKGEFLGASYEKGTLVVPELSKEFSKLPTENIGNNDLNSSWIKNVGAIDEKDFKKAYGKEFKVEQFNNPFHIRKFQNASVEKVVQAFRDIKLPRSFDQSFSGGFSDGLPQTHAHLGEVKIVIGKTTMNGEPIEVLFASAKDRPDLIWIESIRFTNTKANSHGIDSHTIGGGILTAKPMDYGFQVPHSINPKKLVNEYVDTRQYMQENPLIVQYKKLHGV